MDRTMRAAFVALAMLVAASANANAHPHVFVTSKSEIVYAKQGVLAGIRQVWTFDDMFSAFAVQGLDTNHDGVTSKEELQPLAQTNVESLKEFDYFTFVKIGGTSILLKPPTDYWLDYADGKLALHFFLPLATPQVQGTKPLVVEIYDGTYFVAFDLAADQPATVTGAEGCAVNITKPKPIDPAQAAIAAQLDINDPGTLATNPSFGAALANHILVNCP
jgi:ABC-type uncharacterized transport system substrate-binding protein